MGTVSLCYSIPRTPHVLVGPELQRFYPDFRVLFQMIPNHFLPPHFYLEIRQEKGGSSRSKESKGLVQDAIIVYSPS